MIVLVLDVAQHAKFDEFFLDLLYGAGFDFDDGLVMRENLPEVHFQEDFMEVVHEVNEAANFQLVVRLSKCQILLLILSDSLFVKLDYFLQRQTFFF